MVGKQRLVGKGLLVKKLVGNNWYRKVGGKKVGGKKFVGSGKLGVRGKRFVG
jgi:hypothetical protein